MNKWDERFIQLAKLISTWSKDPSTKCGAVITRKNRIISLGYNGFATGVEDTESRYNDRDFKYPAVLHSEENAILFAKQDLSNCTIYVYPMPPCARCAAKIIQVGIKRIVTIRPNQDKLERWKSDFMIADEMYNDCGIEFHYVDQSKL